MYELSRIRLYSVGPPGARYEDVTIDLSEVGQLVPQQRLSMLGESTPRRPSPASVLFLENGGGKSVLMKLIFSVVLPGKRQIVGTSNTRVLEKFVVRGQVAHVVLEWMHTETGRLLVTGKMSHWQAKKNAADDGMAEVWYSLRPSPSVGLTALPLAEDGENLAASEFRARLTELDEHDPAVELFWADRHNKWETRLTALGLDPELFEFQRRMNAGEGEAAETFTFKTDEALIDFLLKAVLPEADATSFAESLEEYANRLSERDTLELEHDFVSTALDKLGPLATQYTATDAVWQRSTDRQEEANRFIASIAARIDREQGRATEQRKNVERATTAFEAARSEEACAAAIHAELLRRLAHLRVDEAKATFDTAKRTVSAAAAVVEGWKATKPFINWSAKNQTANQLQVVLGEKQNAEATALSYRDAWASALVRALHEVTTRAKQAAAEEDEEAGKLTRAAEEAQRVRDEAVGEAASAQATVETLLGRVSEVSQEIEQAVRDGLVPDVQSVSSAAEALAEVAEAAASAVTQQETLITELDGRLESAQTKLIDARAELNTAQSDYDKANTAVENARAATQALAERPRLLELTDAADIVLESDSERLVLALGDALASASRERTDLSVAEAEDERARLALDSGDDALYPPPPEIEELVQLLRDEQVRCHSGWDVLADIPDEEERRELVARLPHLAAGVLLNDPADLDRAARIVKAHEFETTYLVTVATTQSFDAETDERFDLVPTGEAGFVVAANRALYEHDAARAERDRINERHLRRQERIAALIAHVDTDEQLRARLIRWREEYPPGRLGGLAGQLSTAEDLLAKATKAVAGHAGAADDAKQARDDVRRARVALVTVAREAEARAARAGRLAERGAKIVEWNRAAETARTEQRAQAARADQHGKLRDERHAKATEHGRAADLQRATIERVREEINEVGGESVTDPTVQPPAESVSVLRELLREAEIACLKAQVGSDFVAEVTGAKKAADEARGVLAAFSEEAQACAQRLLVTPEGADAAGRSAALAIAEKQLGVDAENRDQALSTLSERKTQLSALPEPVQPVTLPEEPTDIGQAQRLCDEATGALDEAERVVLGKAQERVTVDGALRRTEKIVLGFVRITDTLTATDDAPQDVPALAAPYGGDADTAWTRYIEVRKALNEVRKALSEARRILGQKAEELRTSVSDPRFIKLVSAVRTQITGVAPSELAPLAESWSAALRPRLLSLNEDLAQGERNRTVLVNRLCGMVENALRTLRQTQRLSRLPAGLGEWSGEEFLRFTFTAVEGDVLTQQLFQVVDDAARRTDVKRDGTSILLRGVRAAAPRGFKVTMLKPDAVLRTERVRVSEVHDVFSGGQHLTAAIMFYCTLAALRANNQGKLNHRHSGVLFLDNPIGRASAGYLLDLQRGVAAALGVQLVYTTGLFDAEALGAFPLIVRLRNDADLRAGRKYLSVDERVKSVLHNLAEPDGTARISANRVIFKERQRADHN